MEAVADWIGIAAVLIHLLRELDLDDVEVGEGGEPGRIERDFDEPEVDFFAVRQLNGQGFHYDTGIPLTFVLSRKGRGNTAVARRRRIASHRREEVAVRRSILGNPLLT